MEIYQNPEGIRWGCGYESPRNKCLWTTDLDGMLLFVKPERELTVCTPAPKAKRGYIRRRWNMFDTLGDKPKVRLTKYVYVFSSDDRTTPMKFGTYPRRDPYAAFMDERLKNIPASLVATIPTPIYRSCAGEVINRKALREALKEKSVIRWNLVESEVVDDDAAFAALKAFNTRNGKPRAADPKDYDPRFAETDAFVVRPGDFTEQRRLDDNTAKWYYTPNLRKNLSIWVTYGDLDEEDEFEEFEPSEEYTTNVVMGKDSRKTYEPLILTEVNFYGISPYKKDFPSVKERKYWIGEVYRRNRAAGYRSTVCLSEAIGAYFKVDEGTVRRCAARAELCNDAGVITGTSIPVKAPVVITGDWVLKPMRAQRYIVPWTTIDGLRPWWMWTFSGDKDTTYAAKRQDL